MDAAPARGRVHAHQPLLRARRTGSAGPHLRRGGPLTATGLVERIPRTRSFALIVDDPDAPGGTFTHWLGWGIEAQATGFMEGERAPLEGRNDFENVGYGGPCPPSGHGTHRYFFRLHALDAEVEVASGAGRDELEPALDGRVIAVAELVGTYER